MTTLAHGLGPSHVGGLAVCIMGSMGRFANRGCFLALLSWRDSCMYCKSVDGEVGWGNFNILSWSFNF